jgi:hypothetical protein
MEFGLVPSDRIVPRFDPRIIAHVSTPALLLFERFAFGISFGQHCCSFLFFEVEQSETQLRVLKQSSISFGFSSILNRGEMAEEVSLRAVSEEQYCLWPLQVVISWRSSQPQ